MGFNSGFKGLRMPCILLYYRAFALKFLQKLIACGGNEVGDKQDGER